MEIRNALIIGGSGFLGSRVAHVLSRRGCNVTVPTRRRERAKHLLTLPTVDVVEADVHDPRVLERLMEGQDAVFSLVGILHGRNGSPYGPDFARAHVALPRDIAAACVRSGVGRLVHVSALKAHRAAPSQYLRSKAAGEEAVREVKDLATTIFRPSVIFGPRDSFLNMFAELVRSAPVLPLACPQARFQPVFVEDVANALVECLTRQESWGQAYELCGPQVYTLRQLVAYVCELTGMRRPIVGLSPAASQLMALALELAPGTLMSRDNVASMQVDSVCSGCELPFGATPTALEAVAPGYIGAHAPRTRFSPMRTRARR